MKTRYWLEVAAVIFLLVFALYITNQFNSFLLNH